MHLFTCFQRVPCGTSKLIRAPKRRGVQRTHHQCPTLADSTTSPLQLLLSFINGRYRSWSGAFHLFPARNTASPRWRCCSSRPPFERRRPSRSPGCSAMETSCAARCSLSPRSSARSAEGPRREMSDSFRRRVRRAAPVHERQAAPYPRHSRRTQGCGVRHSRARTIVATRKTCTF